MRPFHLSQIARVALVAPPRVRLGSIGMLLDCFELTRAQIWRQYSAIDNLSAADKFDVSQVRLLSVDGRAPKTAGGVALPVADGLTDEAFDIVAIADHAPAGPVDWAATPLPEWIRGQGARGAVVAACGASVEALAASGLCDGRVLAAPPSLAAALAARWPAVSFDAGRETVEDGNVLSGRGGVADLAVASRLVTAVTSRNTGRWLDIQLGLAAASDDGGGGDPDSLLERAREWLADRYSQPVRIDAMAEALGVDRRTLHRHFLKGTGRTPIAYLQSLRIEAAKRMLERTDFPVERIAALVGYSDAGFFRETFRRTAGQTPRTWRKESRASPM